MIRPRPFTVAFGCLGLLLSSACASRQAPDTAPAPAQTTSADLETQIAQYVDVQTALAADDFDDAKTALQELLTVADATTSPLVRAAASAADIATMRARFKPLSEYLAAQDLPLGYARAYCPMYDGGSNWVQADGPVRNPYYGSVMLTCGVVDAAPGAHMDHSPRHAGTVFMAPDSFHHIEGTYPETGVFRLYATDNYREPVTMSEWGGRVVLEEEYDPNTDEFTEVVAFDLVPSPGGDYLEAVVGDLPPPAEFIAKVAFGVDGEQFPEERFDFIFSEYSGGTSPPARSLATAVTDAAVPLATRIQPEIPQLTSELVSEIGVRAQQLQELVTAGRFTEIFIPALQGKALALELETRADLDDLPTRRQSELRIAVRHLVRAAYLLDWYGDLGNKQQVGGAYDIFSVAVSEITRAYEGAP